jgi:hypothetical protein
MREVAESQSHLLGLYTTTQIELAKIKADALIAAQGMQTKTVLARFADEKMRDLSSTLNRSQQAFMASMRPQFEDLERYTDIPELHKPAYEAIVHHIEVYFETTQRLLDGFSAALNKRVGETTG